MIADPDPGDESRVVLCTPTGRDSALIADTLSAARISCHNCRSISEVVERIDAGCATLLSRGGGERRFCKSVSLEPSMLSLPGPISRYCPDEYW